MARKRRVAAAMLLVLLVAMVVISAVVIRDRQKCPPGPWAQPLDGLFGDGTIKFACLQQLGEDEYVGG